MRALLAAVVVAVAGCAVPAPLEGATLALDVTPDVLLPNGTLEATATVTNPGLDPVVIGATCSDIADIELRFPDGTRLGAPDRSCEKRGVANTLEPGGQAGRRQTWPPVFWANHPEAGAGVYTLVATTTWRTPEGDPREITAKTTFEWTGHS